MWKALLAFAALVGDTPTLTDKDPARRIRAIEAFRGKTESLLPLLADEHPRVRLKAIEALAGAELPGHRPPNPLVRSGLCEVLGGRKDPVPLFPFLSDSDPRVRGAAARALGRIGSKEAVPPLLAAFRKEPDWPLRAHALEALARLSPDDFPEEAASDRHYQVRLVAAEVRPTGPLVEDRDWRVRAAAIEGCRRLRTRESVGWLVEQLGRETGRLRWDLHSALQDLAGRDLGLDPRPWKTWWEANRETFQPPPRPGAVAAPTGTQSSFFKIPILSTRILFVLDLSGSMREPSPDGDTKLDAARRGLLETLRSLPPDARFGILGLGCEEDGRYADREKKTWQRRLALLPATPAARADAERFVRGLEARGWTNLYDGLEYAFSDPDVDTIFLYTDGGASKGTFVAASEILSQLALLNRFRKIVIHSVEVPSERNPADNRRLLSGISARTGGLARLFEK